MKIPIPKSCISRLFERRLGQFSLCIFKDGMRISGLVAWEKRSFEYGTSPRRQAVSSVGYVLCEQMGIVCKFYLQCYSDEYDGF